MSSKREHTLWVEKYRSQTLEDYVGNENIKQTIGHYLKQNDIQNFLFYGTAGTGKTTLAKLIVNNLDCEYLYINASDENGIDTIREKVKGFASVASFKPFKVVILDEADYITIQGQAALRNIIETFSRSTRFILTCNYIERVIDPLQSRCQIFNLTPPLEGILNRIIFILKSEGIQVPVEEKSKLVELVRNGYPDLRRIINDIQKFSYNGTLSIKENNARGLAEKVVNKILQKNDPSELRKFVIERESEFSNDYLQLMKEMFETIFKLGIDQNKKSSLLLTISEGMYKDAIVVDKEINWFSTCLKIY